MPRTPDAHAPTVLRVFIVLLGAVVLAAGAPAQLRAAQDAAAAALPTPALLTDADVERFLREAKIANVRDAPKGITNSLRATLTDGVLTHDAHIQTIDEHRREFRGRNTFELDFRDSWSFNVAAYKLDRLIGLNMIPVSVAGRYKSTPAAITLWVDDVMMDEGGRVKKKVQPPHEKRQYWNEQVYMMRLFDELIYNTDRNLGNMLISSTWRLWLIDHTRAFRKHTKLKSPHAVTRCDRAVLARLKALDEPTLRRELGRYLDGGQIRSLLARRDRIVEAIESRGPAALFDRALGTVP